MAAKSKSSVVWIVAICGVAALVLWRMSDKPREPRSVAQTRPASKPVDESEGVRGAAVMVAKKVLPQVLKFPDSAEYPMDTMTAEKQEDGLWLVSGEVIAVNALKVKDRMPYTVTILSRGDNLSGVKVTLEDKVVMDLIKLK